MRQSMVRAFVIGALFLALFGPVGGLAGEAGSKGPRIPGNPPVETPIPLPRIQINQEGPNAELVLRPRPAPVLSSNEAAASRTAASASSPVCEADFWKPSRIEFDGSSRFLATGVWTGTELLIWGGVNEDVWFLAGSRYNPATGTWIPMSTTNQPSLRIWHTAVWTGTEMIIWGGFDVTSGASTNSGARYNPATDTWSPMTSSNTPVPRDSHSAVWTGSEMLVWGGFSDNGSSGTEVSHGGRYDPATDSWTPMSMAGEPGGRSSPSAVWSGQQLLVYGGYVCYSYGCDLPPTGGRYDPANDSWTLMPALGGGPGRYGHSAVWTGSRMAIWGGIGPGAYLGSGSLYDPVLDQWSPISGSGAPAPRQDHSAVMIGGNMIVFGGVSSLANYSDVGIYDPATNHWVGVASPSSPLGRHAHVAVSTGSKMLVWGGACTIFDGTGWTGFYTDTGGLFDPVQHSWQPTAMPDSPEARYFHTAVWTGSKVLIWGGYDSQHELGTGGIFDPASDRYLPMSSLGAPTARSGHTAVWTGSEMLIWGGQKQNVSLSSGGRYDPLTDTWFPMSNAPVARSDQAAAWTGTELLVWGGYDQSAKSGGFAYDPVSDTWSSMSNSGSPPSARYRASSVFASGAFIVWGGATGTQSLADGAALDLATGVWSALPTTGAPTARRASGAVWTGTDMLVWAGRPVYYLAPEPTGAAYNPTQQTWRPIAPVTQVAMTSDPTIVWTGSHMLVWNVESSPSQVEGLLYDPMVDLWSPMSTQNVNPSPRAGESGVWTGEELIVWGGTFNFLGAARSRNTGGRYVPAPDPDHDGFFGGCDNCPDLPSSDQLDTDQDLQGNACDSDDDNDGVLDTNDNCALATNPGQLDADADIIGDACDNCGQTSNTDQSDQDTDGVGDVCDDCQFHLNPTQVDTDSDGVGDACDNCFWIQNSAQSDSDFDSHGDACDTCPALSNPNQMDSDADGYGDVCDFTLIAPASGAVFGSANAPPLFVWLPFEYSVFRVEISRTPNPFVPFFSSTKKLKPGASYLPPAKKWKKVLKKFPYGGLLYWRVIGAAGKTSPEVPSDQVYTLYMIN